MAANVETMFYVRETPWHGLGVKVASAPKSQEALRLAGLDWKVIQEPIYTGNEEKIEGFKANVRDLDRKVLGVVTDRYKIIQNEEAFAFTDELLGEGVRYETAGSLMGGRKVWLLARLPHEYIITGERISPYLVFSNTHDGSGAVKVAPYTGGLQQHFKSCVVHGKAFLVYGAHRECQRQAQGGWRYDVFGRKVHGQSGERV